MEISLSELKPILKYVIKNNKTLETKGQMPVAVDIEGEAGLGKSFLVKELAEELNCNYVKLSLAMISETGDITGYPIRLHYVCKEDGSDCQWISPELIENYTKAGYTITSETKMSYALPEWFKQIDPSKDTILLLDDFSRCLPHIANAIMELIYQQEFWSFKLPKGSTVILTGNPENSDYNVTSTLDEAQRSRMLTFNVKFDVNSWASWAESNEIDSRAINFMLAYSSELMDPKDTHTHIMNARSYTMFSNTICGIENWENPTNLALIHQIAAGSFNDKDNVVGRLFTLFIANKLDKLITPEDLLLKDWSVVKNEIKTCVHKSNGDYKPEVAAILHTRLLNYSDYYFSKKGSKTDIVQDRLIALIDAANSVKTESDILFTEDFLFDIIRNLVKKYPARTNKFMLNPKIRAKLM